MVEAVYKSLTGIKFRQIAAELAAYLALLLPFALANGMAILQSIDQPLYCAKIIVLVLPLSYLCFQLWKNSLWVRMLSFVLALLAGFELYLLQQIGTASGSSVFSILLSSHSAEALAYLQERVSPLLFWIVLCICSHFMARYWSDRSHIRPNGFAVLCLFCLAGYATYLGALSADTYLREQNSNRYPVAPQHAGEKLFGVAYLSPVFSTIKDSFPFGLPVRIWLFWQEEKVMQAMETQLTGFRFNARQTSAKKEDLTVVLVLGETARFDRFSVNAYTRDTSPRLMRLQQQAELISMQNMITPRSFTMGSIPIYLSGRDIMTEGLKQKSLITAFKEAGFTSYFLSTQVKKGFLNNVTSVYANEADHQMYFEADESRGHLFDEALLEPLKTITQGARGKKLIVLHTMGSHAIYRARYPKAFEKYPVSGEGIESVANSFDNTIYYTDYVLGAVIEQLRTLPGYALMVYGSDHGESLPSTTCQFIGHGALNEENLRVPYFVWANAKYRELHNDKWQNLLRNQTKPTMTTSNFATLLDLADIRFDGFVEQDSLAAKYQGKTPRWVLDMQGNQVDFDEAIKKPGKCGVLSPH